MKTKTVNNKWSEGIKIKVDVFQPSCEGVSEVSNQAYRASKQSVARGHAAEQVSGVSGASVASDLVPAIFFG